jgi:hypothetical protein
MAAVLLYQSFWQNAASLWYSPAHDRNGHYRRSQTVATALRDGNARALVTEIHSADVWPPLHPLLTGALLAVGGNDYRLAVLPCLGAWAATCWLAFALAWRMAPRHKFLAGGVALLLTLTSPAHRAFATDIMLESLGASLTLAGLYFYVSARQDRSVWRGVCFAVLLLALFMTKYNYWTLLVAGLCLAALWEWRSFLVEKLRTLAQSGPLLRALVAQVRHPLTYLLLPAWALALYVKFAGGMSFTVAGRNVTVGSLAFPAQLCFVLLLLRLLPWWWRSGRQIIAGLPCPARQVVQWHVYPLCLWFLWPRRLSIYIWYVTFTQHGRAGASDPWTGNLAYYWQRLTDDYHASLTSLVVVLVLVAVAVLLCRRWEPASLAVLVFLAVAALLTNYHSANRSRFLHSWWAVTWVVAGVGAAGSLEWLGRLLTRRAGLVVPAAACAALVGVACLQGGVLVAPGHAEEGGLKPACPSLLCLADAVMPEVADARRPAVLSDVPFHLLLDWRRGECQEHSPLFLAPPRKLLTAPAPGQLDAWLEQSSCDVVLLIDAPRSPDALPAPAVSPARVRNLLASSGKFVLTSERHLPAIGVVTVEVWRPAPRRTARR